VIQFDVRFPLQKSMASDIDSQSPRCGALGPALQSAGTGQVIVYPAIVARARRVTVPKRR
jgi:hypothetical protein